RYQQNEVAAWEEEEKSLIRRRIKEGDETLKMLLRFVEDFKSCSLGSVTEENLATRLTNAWAEYFKLRFPRKNYGSDSHWLATVAHDIDDEVMPLLRTLRDWKGDDHPKVEELFSNERMARELALEERIDIMIDKAIKRICQIKTAKEVVIRFHHAS